jgi:hypothetical protein
LRVRIREEAPVDERLGGPAETAGEDQRRLAAALDSARSGLIALDPIKASLEVARVVADDARPR